MTLHLHDTLARAKRPFQPRDPQRVTLYVCGPTVYDYAHIGNARPAVVFDVLFRVLRRLYGSEHVIYARNVTDVDDKINAKAAAEGVPIATITERYEAAYLDDMGQLNVLPPTLAPHATAHIGAIVDQIGAILARGHAYAAEGHVLFDVSAFPDYGRLSNRSTDDMIAGARVEVAPYKRNPADFVLWKPSKPGEPEWPSPWGAGRPGWHIECSAMIEANLGLPIDIHGGGHDLIFPHHENELAQGRCAHGDAEYARYWVHNGFLTMGAEKMSKSLGNVLLLHDLVQLTPGEVVRWALMAAHYRAPLDWNGELLAIARKNLDRLYRVIQDADLALRGHAFDGEGRRAEIEALVEQHVLAPLLDDLNTPLAVAGLFALADEVRASLKGKLDTAAREAVAIRRAALLSAAELLGALQSDPDAWFKGGADPETVSKIEGLIAARADARAAKDWPEADRIRGELAALGVEIMDGAQGATWRFRETD
jgi:cysteinyl-tRNA synthetase